MFKIVLKDGFLRGFEDRGQIDVPSVEFDFGSCFFPSFCAFNDGIQIEAQIFDGAQALKHVETAACKMEQKSAASD